MYIKHRVNRRNNDQQKTIRQQYSSNYLYKDEFQRTNSRVEPGFDILDGVDCLR